MVLQTEHFGAGNSFVDSRCKLGDRIVRALVGVYVSPEVAYARVCDSHDPLRHHFRLGGSRMAAHHGAFAFRKRLS